MPRVDWKLDDKYQDGSRYPFPRLKPGDYGKDFNGSWMVCPPVEGCHAAMLCPGHTVTEHEDGTITVSPSIGIHYGDGKFYHGYLEHGVWREC